MWHFRACFVVVVLLSGGGPSVAGQQKPREPPPAPTPKDSPANPRRPVWKLATDVLGDFRHVPSWDTAGWLSVGSGLALAAHPIDDDVNRRLRGEPWVHDVFLPGKVVGYGATQYAVAAGTYAWGKLHKEPKVVHLGVDLLRAQIVTQVVTIGIKEAVRRDRPDGTGLSFPSGHASVTFASATVLERHLGWRAAVPTYAVASYVAASRLHENRHFLSDVVFGAAVGVIGGRTVTRHGRNAWTLAPTPIPGGVVLVVARVAAR